MVVGLTTVTAVVALLLQVYELTPDAVNVKLEPAQTTVFEEIAVMVGVGLTITFTALTVLIPQAVESTR